jgi:hypothetical protein
MNIKITSFILAFIITIFGIIDYNFELVNFNFHSTKHEIVRQIFYFFQSLYRFGDFFSWFAFYVFPNLKKSVAFIIGQIVFLPILWAIFYLILKIFFKNKNKELT